MSKEMSASIYEVLKYVIDPELMINIVDLGLIYDIRVDDLKKRIEIDMTLSTPSCPIGDTIVEEVEQVLKDVFSEFEIVVNLVWDPPWSIDRLTPEGRRLLGIS